MRWTNKPGPTWGDVREIRKFLWLPLEIKYEVRWLEFATVRQCYEYGYDLSGWVDVAFI
jgi:hypothetical protein